jgi:Family of unknown function (DUF5681)
MPFQSGQSGNPAGRPRGARNKRTLALENIMEGESEAITRKAIEMAKGGHIAAIRLVIDRLAPVCRDRPVDFELPPLEKPEDAVAASAKIAAAGDLTPAEAAHLSKVVHAYVQALEAHVFDQRLAKIEQDMQDDTARNGHDFPAVSHS